MGDHDEGPHVDPSPACSPLRGFLGVRITGYRNRPTGPLLLLGTLSRSDSSVWAGSRTPDGRDLDEVRRRNREAMRYAMQRRGAEQGTIVASARQGGCTLEVLEPEA